MLGWIHTLIVWSDFLRGDTHGCLEHARQAVDLAERVGSAFSRVFAYDALGLAHNLSGQWPEHRLFLAVGAPRRAEQVAAELRALRTPARPQRASLGAQR